MDNPTNVFGTSAPVSRQIRVRLYRKYLATPEGRHMLAQSMIRPIQDVLKQEGPAPIRKQQGRRMLRWGERVLGRALVEQQDLSYLGDPDSSGSVNFLALLRQLREECARLH